MRLSRIASRIAVVVVALPAFAATPAAIGPAATPVKRASDASKPPTPPGITPVAAPTASVIAVVTASVANVAASYGMTVKLKGQVKSSVPGSMVGYKMYFEVYGKAVGTTTSDADGMGSVDLPITDAMSVGVHVLTLLAHSYDGKTYHGEANLDIVKTETNLGFALGYPGSNKVAEQETAITFKGQLKRITDSGDTGPEARKIELKIDDKVVASTHTDANGHYSHVYTIPKSMSPGAHTAEVAFDGDGHYLATAASNRESFTVKLKPRLPPNVINGPSLHGSGIY